MKRSHTKSFILTFEAGLSKKDRDICEQKLRIGKSMYNAFLNESLKRYRACNSDNRYLELLNLYQAPKKTKYLLQNEIAKIEKTSNSEDLKYLKEELKQAEELLKQYSTEMNMIKNKYNWGSEYCLSDYRKIQSNHFKGSLGADVATKISRRAYRAVEKLEKDSNTIKVTHINIHDDFSIEGINNKNGIIYRNNTIYFDIRKNIHVNIKPARKNDYEYYREALKNRIKYCRLLSKTIRGKKRYYIQLILEGTPPNHRKYGDNQIELLDVKISNIVIKKQGEETKTIELAPNCKNPEQKIAELDKKLLNSLKTSNPENFEESGQIKKGANKWDRSKNYEKYRKRRKELYRIMAERRKVSHEELTNKILSEGSDIVVKSLSYKKYQMGFMISNLDSNKNIIIKQGKNISNRAPAKFISILERKLDYIDKKPKY